MHKKPDDSISTEFGDSGVKRVLERVSGSFGVEVAVEQVSSRGRVLGVKFSGQISAKLDIYEFFDELASALEEESGFPYAVWDHQEMLDFESYFLVKLVNLDFLDEIKGAMDKVGGLVRRRLREFERIGGDEDNMFKELCFCLLTANFTAEGGMKIQQAVGDGFLKLQEAELAGRLRELGHRYPSARARYIVEARQLYGKLNVKLRGFRNGGEAREWLVKNVKGLGYKEAGHFLRNIGLKDVAIIDRHILRFLKDKKLIEEVPKSLNWKRYLKLEKLLSILAGRLKLSLGEQDLYLWYLMTGKVLK